MFRLPAALRKLLLPLNTNTNKTVSANKVQALYADVRRAFLGSVAREIQHQSRSQRQKTLDKKRVKILNVEIDNIDALDFLRQLKHGVVFTPNVDHVMKLQEDEEFVQAYRRADYKVCDSQILMYASKFLGTPLKAKISGSDLLPMFCQHHQHNEAIKIFMLGGAEGVAERARQNINAKLGREIIIQAHSPSFGFEQNKMECQEILEQIKHSGANVLVVGVGAPKQEKWIAQYRDCLPNIDIFLAVGAAIDFEAGNKPRAPRYISELGFEWLYRLLSEPNRLWKRYLLRDMPFVWMILQARFMQTKLEREQQPS
ncbi:MAG: WecB/TagA/CpsF family glycosyltransferase [Leptolyngbyaceae cyanobacterium SM1_1_3]|nr:WecB/TagA/CpsF family glycosyltransferase [Leptolyngbyaceae cyanobacterium SM1_1_3]NJN03227.1 WecB/TagA/CpsF family glycosyltransferase [Leptolyngbyaceae cyanobacterium RM1_1_2]